MDDPPVAGNANLQEHHFVKADEVDQTGSDIIPVSDDQLMEEVAEGLRQEQFSQTADSTSVGVPTQGGKVLRRPELKRDAVAPPPPLQPPPPAPIQQNQERPPTSLTLSELRQLLCDAPKPEQPAYAFEYADSQPFPQEVEEWFQYSEFDQVMLLGMRSSWEPKWTAFCERQPSNSPTLSWIDASYELRKSFMSQVLSTLWDADLPARVEALEVVCYAVTGVWGDTAGKAMEQYPEDPTREMAAEMPKFKSMQIKWMENNVSLLQECAGIGPLLEHLSRAFDKSRDSPSADSDGAESVNTISARAAESEREMNLLLTALYFVVEVGRRQESHDPRHTPVRDVLTSSKPSLLVLLVEIIARLRWDDSANIPLTRIILLFWKSLLLFFGGSESLKKAKEELEPFPEGKQNAISRRVPFLTASPLDYHVFRQEITSKYPAYNPPPPIVPLELENNSVLPPLPQHPSRSTSSSGIFSGVGPPVAGGNGSILHQSVHIATPAPSPPPSPIGPGGKTGKKQNYQTNQNFPFMYPPLDSSSNEIGGKGTTELQDVLVGKKWEGSDVPASVIEAGKLFSSHVKMTRAMRQLWEEREHFMKYDRGWNLDDTASPSGEASAGDLAESLQDLDLSEQKRDQSDPSQKETDNEDIQRRLNAVESFYVRSLPTERLIRLTYSSVARACASAVDHHCLFKSYPRKC